MMLSPLQPLMDYINSGEESLSKARNLYDVSIEWLKDKNHPQYSEVVTTLFSLLLTVGEKIGPTSLAFKAIEEIKRAQGAEIDPDLVEFLELQKKNFSIFHHH